MPMHTQQAQVSGAVTKLQQAPFTVSTAGKESAMIWICSVLTIVASSPAAARGRSSHRVAFTLTARISSFAFITQ